MIHYKIVWNTPKKTHEKITILSRATPLESFNTLEDVSYIEAFSFHKKNTLNTIEIEEHNSGTIEVFGKLVTISGMTPEEFHIAKCGILFGKKLMDTMCTNLINNKQII